jgi:6-phosphogluconate dehydrogenase
MRVALFSWESLHSISIGGLGVHVSELAAGFERRGHEIHVFTRRKSWQCRMIARWRYSSPNRSRYQ